LIEGDVFEVVLDGPYDVIIASHIFHHFQRAAFPYLFSVVMLAWSREGEAYSLDTYQKLLHEAGFSPTRGSWE
jgi:hypothetical protein